MHWNKSTANTEGPFSQVSTKMIQRGLLEACVSVCGVHICMVPSPTHNSSITRCDRTQGFYIVKVNVKIEIHCTHPVSVEFILGALSGELANRPLQHEKHYQCSFRQRPSIAGFMMNLNQVESSALAHLNVNKWAWEQVKEMVSSENTQHGIHSPSTGGRLGWSTLDTSQFHFWITSECSRASGWPRHPVLEGLLDSGRQKENSLLLWTHFHLWADTPILSAHHTHHLLLRGSTHLGCTLWTMWQPLPANWTQGQPAKVGQWSMMSAAQTPYPNNGQWGQILVPGFWGGFCFVLCF